MSDPARGEIYAGVQGDLDLGAAEEAVLAAVESDATRLLELVGRPEAELSVVLCDDAFIQPLNAEWRGKDAPTDVLSFAMQEGDDLLEDDPVLGDLVISVETADRQAAEQGHDRAAELRVLLVHGLLHLLGFDHEDTPERAAEMRAEEARLVAALGGTAGLIERVGA